MNTHDKFMEYLLKLGLKELTPSGAPSTVPLYVRAVEKVLAAEGLTMATVTAEQMGALVRMYDVGGEKEAIGAEGHRTVICALKRFQEMLRDPNV